MNQHIADGNVTVKDKNRVGSNANEYVNYFNRRR